MMENKIIFEWHIPADYPNFTGYDDLPQAYRVFENTQAAGGIIIESLYNGKWEPNPWNVRTLIRELLERLTDEQ